MSRRLNVGIELTGIVSPGGAKMKAEIGTDTVVFRSAIKMEVPFEEITPEVRGTLLVLRFRGHTVELGAGAKASSFASAIRSPPSRLDRLGIEYGISAAVAGPIEAAFKSELGNRAVVAAGVPKSPVDAVFFAVDGVAGLEALPKLVPLVALEGALWVVHPSGVPELPESKVIAAVKAVGFKHQRSARFSGTHVAQRFGRT